MKSIIAANKYLHSIEPNLTIYKSNEGYFYFISYNKIFPKSLYCYSIKDITKKDLDSAIEEYKNN